MLVYYVPGGSHSPHQPKKEWVDKFKGKFDMGWNALREQIFANQQRLGVIPAGAKLTDWPDDLPKWDTLSADQKKLFARQAEVFAGYTAYTDHEIGRVIQQVEDMGKLDNTLIIYIDGDNGTSPEGTLSGTPNQYTAYNGILDFPIAEQLKFYDAWGSAATYPHIAVAWSWAFDTPFKWTKQIASHFGGTRQGLAISWPNRIKDVGGVRNQFHHIIDIVPTILEATGVKAPEMVDGIQQKPIEGVSMVYTFDKANADAPSTRKTQYFEMIANRGIYHEGWYANTTPPHGPWILNAPLPPPNEYKWELYNLTEDYSQAKDPAQFLALAHHAVRAQVGSTMHADTEPVHGHHRRAQIASDHAKTEAIAGENDGPLIRVKEQVKDHELFGSGDHRLDEAQPATLGFQRANKASDHPLDLLPRHIFREHAGVQHDELVSKEGHQEAVEGALLDDEHFHLAVVVERLLDLRQHGVERGKIVLIDFGGIPEQSRPEHAHAHPHKEQNSGRQSRKNSKRGNGHQDEEECEGGPGKDRKRVIARFFWMQVSLHIFISHGNPPSPKFL